jgi:P-type E1-E2 ATPase
MIAALVIASRKGIMIRNSSFVETLANIDTIIFDKTGTVTTGSYQIVDLVPENNVSESELVSAAAVCATGSMHPVSQAIARYALENSINVNKAESQQELHGKGVEANFNKTSYLLGRSEWISEKINRKFSGDLSNDLSTVWVAVDKKLLGRITLADLPRPEFKDIMAECRKQNIKEIFLLTGDRKMVAEKIGKLFSFDLIQAECLPQHKLDFVQKCKEQGKKVMFVGDGINDALALKASDVGVAIGVGGSDIAIQSSDITLKSESLASIPFMFRLSRKIHRTINQNILIGTGFSLLMITMATLGIITPVWGAISHNLGTLFVLINSASLLSKKGELA